MELIHSGASKVISRTPYGKEAAADTTDVTDSHLVKMWNQFWKENWMRLVYSTWIEREVITAILTSNPSRSS